ncbi:MAG: mechanosensitive ion channel family protein [Anaerolineae bacterium]
MENLSGFIFNENLRQLIIAAAIVIGVAILARLSILFLDRVVMRLIGRTKTALDDMILDTLRTPLFVAMLLLGLKIAIGQLTFLDTAWIALFDDLLFMAFVLVGYLLIYRLLKNLLEWYAQNVAAKTETNIDEQLIPFLRRLLQIALTAIVLVMILAHFGLDISALVATLGVGSLAIALAAQTVLADTLAGFTIMMDRPFAVGDRILLPKSIGGTYGEWGDVVEIGLRSTRVRSVDGVLLTVPNSVITKDVVANFSHSESPNLRVRVRLGLVPHLENVRRAMAAIKEIVDRNPNVSKYPREPQVVLREIRDYDVLLELRFYVDDPRKMRTTKSEVIEQMLRVFEEEEIKTSFPAQMVLLQGQEEEGG